jgi:hypothetical protein
MTEGLLSLSLMLSPFDHHHFIAQSLQHRLNHSSSHFRTPPLSPCGKSWLLVSWDAQASSGVASVAPSVSPPATTRLPHYLKLHVLLAPCWECSSPSTLAADSAEPISDRSPSKPFLNPKGAHSASCTSLSSALDLRPLPLKSPLLRAGNRTILCSYT